MLAPRPSGGPNSFADPAPSGPTMTGMFSRKHSPRAAVDALLAVLDPLAVRPRMRELAAWTRGHARSGSPSELQALLDELDVRGPYGRRLAVVAATVAGDVRFLESRLADPDAAVRAHALKASRHLPISDAALARAMEDAPYAVRRQIATAVLTGARTDLADRLIGSVRELWGDEEAARLLSGCGAPMVERLLPGLFLAVTNWRALGRRYPDLVLDEAARQLAGLAEQERAAWWSRNADLFATTVEARPSRVLDVLERHCPARLPGPVHACLGRLVRESPQRTVALLTAPERSDLSGWNLLSGTALGRLARSGAPEFTDLGRAWGQSPKVLVPLLKALPPSRREAFYDAVTAGQDLSRSCLDGTLLDVLPRRRAQAEARRMALRSAERGEPWSTVLAAVAHLPVEEARERLLAATRRPAAEDRALAYPLLIANVARSRERSALETLLEDLRKLRNEQDPVRSPALAALAEVPPRLFTGADVPLLDRIATDAVEARDNSPRTTRALTTLALALLTEHATSGEHALVEWALTTLLRLTEHTGGVRLGRLDTLLRKGQEFQVFEALRPWTESGADRADFRLVLSLTDSLGHRAHAVPELQELLWRAVRSGGNRTAEQAISLWLAPPATRDERTARVLDLHPSAAVLPAVLRVLTHRRTDLLDAVLGDTPPYGRFLVAKSRWVPPVDGAGAWLPRQQAAAVRLLSRAADNPKLSVHERARHIRAVAAVPGLGFDAVRRHLDSSNTALAEAALAALSWTDRPADAMPLLLAHVADDRARVALYAANRVTARVAPSDLEAVLRAALLPSAADAPAPAAKVTSRKELVRLAASRLPVEVAAALLADAFELPGQHSDVRAACVPVATQLLRSPAAWRLLEQAADGPAVTQKAVLRITPYDVQAAERPRCAQLVGRVADSADRETADAAIGLLARWSPWYDRAAPLLSANTLDLDNRSSWRVAADGLVALAASRQGDGPLLDALTRLVAADASGRHPDAEGDRDRPARRRVAHLVGRLSSAVAAHESEASRTAAVRASELLLASADFVPQGVALFVAALDLDAPAAQLLPALDHLAALHADRPVLAAATGTALGSRLTHRRRPGDPLTFSLAVERLIADGTCAAGLLAVAVTRAFGSRSGWSAPWPAHLRTLRRHPHPDTRAAALSLSTAPG